MSLGGEAVEGDGPLETDPDPTPDVETPPAG